MIIQSLDKKCCDEQRIVCNESFSYECENTCNDMGLDINELMGVL